MGRTPRRPVLLDLRSIGQLEPLEKRVLLSRNPLVAAVASSVQRVDVTPAIVSTQFATKIDRLETRASLPVIHTAAAKALEVSTLSEVSTPSEVSIPPKVSTLPASLTHTISALRSIEQESGSTLAATASSTRLSEVRGSDGVVGYETGSTLVTTTSVAGTTSASVKRDEGVKIDLSAKTDILAGIDSSDREHSISRRLDDITITAAHNSDRPTEPVGRAIEVQLTHRSDRLSVVVEPLSSLRLSSLRKVNDLDVASGVSIAAREKIPTAADVASVSVTQLRVSAELVIDRPVSVVSSRFEKLPRSESPDVSSAPTHEPIAHEPIAHEPSGTLNDRDSTNSDRGEQHQAAAVESREAASTSDDISEVRTGPEMAVRGDAQPVAAVAWLAQKAESHAESQSVDPQAESQWPIADPNSQAEMAAAKFDSPVAETGRSADFVDGSGGLPTALSLEVGDDGTELAQAMTDEQMAEGTSSKSQTMNAAGAFLAVTLGKPLSRLSPANGTSTSGSGAGSAPVGKPQTSDDRQRRRRRTSFRNETAGGHGTTDEELPMRGPKNIPVQLISHRTSLAPGTQASVNRESPLATQLHDLVFEAGADELSTHHRTRDLGDAPAEAETKHAGGPWSLTEMAVAGISVAALAEGVILSKRRLAHRDFKKRRLAALYQGTTRTQVPGSTDHLSGGSTPAARECQEPAFTGR